MIMKYMNRLWAFATVVSLVLASACGSDDTPDPTEDPIPGEEISGSWFVEEPGDVTGPDDEPADQFADFSIIITATASQVTYTTSENGEPLVFPDGGTFAVEEGDNFTSGADVVRGPDNVDTQITLSEGGNLLTMTFTIDTGIEEGENARVTEIEGEYTFRLQKQQQQQQ
jgi:hypothetical protein